jgi:hypothetical protein
MWVKCGQAVGFSENVNESSSSIKVGIFIEKLATYELIKNKSALCRWSRKLSRQMPQLDAVYDVTIFEGHLQCSQSLFPAK